MDVLNLFDLLNTFYMSMSKLKYYFMYVFEQEKIILEHRRCSGVFIFEFDQIFAHM